MPTAGDISAAIAMLVSAIAVYVAWRKAPAEVATLHAQSQEAGAKTLLQYMQVLQTSAEQVNKLSDRIAVLEERTEKQECEIEELRKDNVLLREWATRLAHQVQSLGAKPVELKEVRQT